MKYKDVVNNHTGPCNATYYEDGKTKKFSDISVFIVTAILEIHLSDEFKCRCYVNPSDFTNGIIHVSYKWGKTRKVFFFVEAIVKGYRNFRVVALEAEDFLAKARQLEDWSA